jgi:DeoR family transcriptional regulator, aga operon transcriptional repressor
VSILAADSLTVRSADGHTPCVSALLERDERLLGLLRDSGRLPVAEIAEQLGVATATVRRDLERLAGEGRLIRTYGGAAPAGRVPADPEAGEAVSQKRAIGAAAAARVRDGQTIVISSGSTTVEMARRLSDRRSLTVITNALDVADALLDCPGIELIVLGGVVRPRMHSLLGHLTEMAAAELSADTLYMGIAAISLEHGLMNLHMPEILSDRALRRMAREVVVLADARKFERVAPANVFGLDEVAAIVTDRGIPEATAAALVERGVEVVIADAAPVAPPRP